MKKIAHILILLVIATAGLTTLSAVAATVKPGIEVLMDRGFDVLQGKRVGLITNPTGIDSRLKATVDILAEAPGVELTALFAPEHGIRGDIPAGATVASGKDAATGVPVHSLYGKTKKPTAAMLSGIDVLVYDIQDNGCRSYTFISTLGLAMEAAAENDVEFVVLDRPNPLGGNRVEGPSVDDDCASFVSRYPIPYLYGLTVGELARYLKGEGLIKSADRLQLTVVDMEGWHRSMTFDQTGLPWVLPSPHIPQASTCIYYPATGIIGELDYLSIGVGYTLPFQAAAAPWIDGVKLADALNALNLPGVGFRPITYTPYYGKFKGSSIGGVEVYVLNYDRVELTTIQFYILQEIHRLYPSRKPLAATDKNSSNLRMFDQVTGSRRFRQLLTANDYRVSAILDLWNSYADRFRTESQKYYLYK